MIKESKIATLFCTGVCHEALDVMLLVSLPFHRAHLWPLGNS
jgi:hypothetical protein